ncbi:3-isopropylmalate dehydratase small subunit [bacterium]|nr:3-isopropylmalate dehydratase small subunit [bacterium]
MIIKGKIHKFGNNINTDEIIPAPYLVTTDIKELGKHCMDGIDSSFATKIHPIRSPTDVSDGSSNNRSELTSNGAKAGDIIVAGRNFGCGSSREHAPLAIQGCGVALVIAQSFARIFYRNCVNVGLPILISDEIYKSINPDDVLEADLSKGEIKNITQNKTFRVSAFPPLLQEIIEAGGLMKWYLKNGSC